MTETTLPQASRYQDGSEKTIMIDGVTVTYRVMGGEWVKVSETGIQTIVVPAGQSFRIVDDAENPSFQLNVFNADNEIGFDGSGFVFSSQPIAEGPFVNMTLFQNQNTESSEYGAFNFFAAASNSAGNTSLNLTLDQYGNSAFATNATDVFFSGIPTYADNAAALAAGLPVGSDYNTPAGARMVVLPGE